MQMQIFVPAESGEWFDESAAAAIVGTTTNVRAMDGTPHPATITDAEVAAGGLGLRLTLDVADLEFDAKLSVSTSTRPG